MVSTPSSLKTLKIMSAPLIGLPANGETLDGDGSILHSLGKLKMQGGRTQCVRMTQHGRKQQVILPERSSRFCILARLSHATGGRMEETGTIAELLKIDRHLVLERAGHQGGLLRQVHGGVAGRGGGHRRPGRVAQLRLGWRRR